jgi:DNA-binding MarR family transcriptional regulator
MAGEKDNGNHGDPEVSPASAMHLLHRAGQYANDIFAMEVGNCDLTPRQFTVLATAAEEEKLTQTELVERTGIDRSTLADIVSRLAARRLIRRRKAKTDGRAYEITLTDAGWESLRDARPRALAADERLLSRLPAAKRQDFLDSLSMIVDGAN